MALYKRQVFFNTAGIVISFAVQYLCQLFLTRFVGFEEAGFFSTVIAVTSPFILISAYGMRSFQIADGYRTYSESAFLITRIFTILLSFLAFFFYSKVLSFDVGLNRAVFVYIMYRNVQQLFDVFSVSIQLSNRLDLCGIGSSIEGVVSFVSFIGMYVWSRSVTGSLAVMVICSSIFNIFFSTAIYKRVTGKTVLSVFKFDKDKLYEGFVIAKMSTLLFIAQFFSVLLTVIPKMILRSYANDVAVGIFSSLSAPTILVSTCSAACFAPFLVYFSNLAHQKQFKKMLQKALLCLSVCLGALLVCLALNHFFGRFCFELLYGEQILPFVGSFICLLCGIFLFAYSNILIQILTVLDCRFLLMILAFLVLAISVPIFVYFIKDSGYHGACIATLITYAIQCVLLFVCFCVVCGCRCNQRKIDFKNDVFLCK